MNNLNQLKNLASSQDSGADTLKNGGSRIFAHPNSAILGDRKTLPPLSPKDMGESMSERFSSYHANMQSHPDGGLPLNFPHLPGNNSRTNDHFEALLEMQRANSLAESLGKRHDLLSQPLDSELPYQDPLFSGKRRPNDNVMDHAAPSPTIINPRYRYQSGPASPAHSFSGGFKLHSSRKNSDLQDLGPELKPQIGKKPSEEVPSNKT
jgi:hypothetical protein